MLEIKQTFESKLATITPTIATVYEGTQYTPIVGTPYQEVFILPALNDNVFIDNSKYISYGIFQITLKYPLSGNASKDILTRIKLYLDNFKSGDNLVKNGITVNILNTPNVKNLGIDGDRLVYVVSINYQAFY